MSDIYEKLRAAETRLGECQAAIQMLRSQVATFEKVARGELSLSNRFPCRVGLLPGGRVAVHVRTSPTEPNEFHVVKPEDLVNCLEHFE